MAAAHDELEVIEPARRRVVLYRDETLEVRPLTIGQLPRFTRAARPLIDELFGEFRDLAAKEPAEEDDAPDVLAAIDPARVCDWIERYTPQLLEAAAAATGKDSEWLSGAEPDQFLELVVAIIAVNLDFFVRRLLPMLAKSVPALVKDLETIHGSGRTRSSSSSPRATPSRK